MKTLPRTKCSDDTERPAAVLEIPRGSIVGGVVMIRIGFVQKSKNFVLKEIQKFSQIVNYAVRLPVNKDRTRVSYHYLSCSSEYVAASMFVL